MTIKMLMFEVRNSEKEFLKETDLSDFNITFYEESLNEDTLKTLSKEEKEETVVISTFITSNVTANIIKEFPNLRYIATRSTGYDHIDVAACTKENVTVLNVENYGAKAVTQFIFGTLICLIRQIIPAVEDVREMNCNFNSYVGKDLSNLTIGVVGTGAIGSGVCKIAHAFEMKILANDLIKRDQLCNLYNVEYVERDFLYENSDIICLNVPFKPPLLHMISTKEFEKMKPTAYLVNASRGELVDLKALYKALEEKQIAGCALDVVECEDWGFYQNNIDYSKKDISEDCEHLTQIIRTLVKLPNVIITPHIAYNTLDAIGYILDTTFSSIIDNIDGGHANNVN